MLCCAGLLAGLRVDRSVLCSALGLWLGCVVVLWCGMVCAVGSVGLCAVLVSGVDFFAGLDYWFGMCFSLVCSVGLAGLWAGLACGLF